MGSKMLAAVEEQHKGWSYQEDSCAAAPSAGPSKPGHVSKQLPGIFLEMVSGTSKASRTPSCFKGLFVASQHRSPASIFPSTHVSNPAESPGTPVCQPPPRPHYAASPNDHIPLSQLAEPSSGDRSLRSPARTEFCQVNLALETPRQSCQWLGGKHAHGKRRQQAQGSVLGGKQRPCWKGAGLFMCFKHNSSTKPPSDKRLAI